MNSSHNLTEVFENLEGGGTAVYVKLEPGRYNVTSTIRLHSDMKQSEIQIQGSNETDTILVVSAELAFDIESGAPHGKLPLDHLQPRPIPDAYANP